MEVQQDVSLSQEQFVAYELVAELLAIDRERLL